MQSKERDCPGLKNIRTNGLYLANLKWPALLNKSPSDPYQHIFGRSITALARKNGEGEIDFI